jgi:DUF4097 and DUF4098 domain-containing protein YvlB
MTEQHFDTPGPLRVEIKIGAGDVRVTSIDGSDSLVVLEGEQEIVDATKVSLTGDRLLIEQRSKSLFGFFGRWDESLHVEARVPHGSTLEIATASADARIDGTFSGLDAKTASGEVSVTGELDGDATVQSVSGNVRVSRLTGDLSVRTVSGEVEAGSVGGSVSAKSVSGDVHVDSLHEGRATVQSVSGDVELGIASGTSIDVDAGSASGAMSSEVPLSETSERDGGPIVVIRSHTVSGDFRVFRAA